MLPRELDGAPRPPIGATWAACHWAKSKLVENPTAPILFSFNMKLLSRGFHVLSFCRTRTLTSWWIFSSLLFSRQEINCHHNLTFLKSEVCNIWPFFVLFFKEETATPSGGTLDWTLSHSPPELTCKLQRPVHPNLDSSSSFYFVPLCSSLVYLNTLIMKQSDSWIVHIRFVRKKKIHMTNWEQDLCYVSLYISHW